MVLDESNNKVTESNISLNEEQEMEFISQIKPATLTMIASILSDMVYVEGGELILTNQNSQAFDYVGVAFGSVGPTVLRAKKTEEFLLAEPLTPQRLEEACLVAQSEVTPIADIRSTAEYRKAMARVLMHEALEPLFK